MNSNKLELVKNITKDKNKEKLIYILVAAVVILIASTYIFNGAESSVKKTEAESITAKQSYIFDESDEQQKLSSIIGKIEGITEVSCYITYKDKGSIIPVYNKNDEIVFEESSSGKAMVIEKTLLPQVEGVIIVGKGMENAETKSKIATAIASVMNIGVYKVQVFDKGD